MQVSISLHSTAPPLPYPLSPASLANTATLTSCPHTTHPAPSRPAPNLQAVLTGMANPALDGCADSGNGLPGPCPTGMTVGNRSPKDGMALEALSVKEICGKVMQLLCGSEGMWEGRCFVLSSRSPPPSSLLLSLTHPPTHPPITYPSTHPPLR